MGGGSGLRLAELERLRRIYSTLRRRPSMDTAPPSNSIPSSMTETDVDNGYEWASLDNEE